MRLSLLQKEVDFRPRIVTLPGVLGRGAKWKRERMKASLIIVTFMLRGLTYVIFLQTILKLN